MKRKETPNLLPREVIIRKIYWLRESKVMMDFDLAALYGVETKQLKRAVRRNINRFPIDFMFELTTDEFENLRCQFGTSNWVGIRYLPMVFTEQGIAMLSSVLRSEIAIGINIVIMRAFVQLRQFLESNKELAKRIEDLEKAVSGYDEKIQLIFSAIKQLMDEKENPVPRNPVGFKIQGESIKN
jgi:hypothetical protein